MQSGASAFRCSCGEAALKITGIVDGRTLVRCPTCGETRPISECEPEARLATLVAPVRDARDRDQAEGAGCRSGPMS